MSTGQLRRFRVWMTIRGGICKPAYDGYIDVWATYDEAFEKAVREARRTAHWDSPPDAFRLDRIEERR